MRIKPVLVPDHTANDLRRLMDHFAEASTGPTKQQLNESRAAVAAAQKTINEGIMDVVKQTFNDCVAGYPQGTSEGQFIQGWARAIRAETGRDIPAEKLTKLYHDYTERSPEIMQSHGTVDEQGVAEAAKWRTHPDAHDHDTDGSPMPKGGIKSDSLATRQGVSRTQSEKDPKSLAGKFGDKYAKKHGVPTKQLMKNIPLDDIDEQGVAEGVDKEARAILRNLIVADVLNFYSMHDRIPSIKEFSRPLIAKLNAL